MWAAALAVGVAADGANADIVALDGFGNAVDWFSIIKLPTSTFEASDLELPYPCHPPRGKPAPRSPRKSFAWACHSRLRLSRPPMSPRPRASPALL